MRPADNVDLMYLRLERGEPPFHVLTVPQRRQLQADLVASRIASHTFAAERQEETEIDHAA